MSELMTFNQIKWSIEHTYSDYYLKDYKAIVWTADDIINTSKYVLDVISKDGNLSAYTDLKNQIWELSDLMLKYCGVDDSYSVTQEQLNDLFIEDFGVANEAEVLTFRNNIKDKHTFGQVIIEQLERFDDLQLIINMDYEEEYKKTLVIDEFKNKHKEHIQEKQVNNANDTQAKKINKTDKFSKILTKEAKEIYSKAIEFGYMDREYNWKLGTSLLAYMTKLIYLKQNTDPYPDTALCKLFNVKGLKQALYRIAENKNGKPRGYEKIDMLFN